MVRTLAVVVALVAVVLLLVPQEPPVVQPAVAVAEVVTAAEQASAELGFAPVTTQVGDGWATDYVRTERRVDDVLQWRLGLRSPSGDRIDVEQTAEATDRWLTRPADGEPTAEEPVVVGGQTWGRLTRGDGLTSYVHRSEPVTTVVSARQDDDELTRAVAAVGADLTG